MTDGLKGGPTGSVSWLKVWLTSWRADLGSVSWLKVWLMSWRADLGSVSWLKVWLTGWRASIDSGKQGNSYTYITDDRIILTRTYRRHGIVKDLGKRFVDFLDLFVPSGSIHVQSFNVCSCNQHLTVNIGYHIAAWCYYHREATYYLSILSWVYKNIP